MRTPARARSLATCGRARLRATRSRSSGPPSTVATIARQGLIPSVADSDDLDATVVIATKPAGLPGPATRNGLELGTGYQTSPPRQSQERSSCARSPATGST